LLCSQRPSPRLLPRGDNRYPLHRGDPVGNFSGWLDHLPYMRLLYQAEGLEGKYDTLNRLKQHDLGQTKIIRLRLFILLL
jgi:hypothetical protein